MDIKTICRLYNLRQKAKLIWFEHFDNQTTISWPDFAEKFERLLMPEQLTKFEKVDIGCYMTDEFRITWTNRT